MEKIASQLLQQISKYPGLPGILATAGASGLAGGYLTGQSAQDPNEKPGQRRMRILRNALLAAGLGGGAAGLLEGGYNRLSTALPADDTPPLTSAIENPVTRGIMGATGAVAANKGFLTRGNESLNARLSLHNWLTRGSSNGGVENKDLITNPKELQILRNVLGEPKALGQAASHISNANQLKALSATPGDREFIMRAIQRRIGEGAGNEGGPVAMTPRLRSIMLNAGMPVGENRFTQGLNKGLFDVAGLNDDIANSGRTISPLFGTLGGAAVGLAAPEIAKGVGSLAGMAINSATNMNPVDLHSMAPPSQYVNPNGL